VRRSVQKKNLEHYTIGTCTCCNTNEPESSLIAPATKIGSTDRESNVFRVQGCNVACWIVVADRVFVQIRGLASNHHVSTAIDGGTTDTGGILPEDLGKMTDVVENIVIKAELAEMGQHSLELALVLALSDASGDIENGTRSREKVLALAGAIRDVVCELTGIGSDSGSVSNGSIPHQRLSTMVGTGLVVME
jgi:hypothetical protein